MSKKLAITITGAVSLGSFEAGVMYEVVRAIGQHNRAVAEADQIYIDVITGASAGGLTATIVAQKLMFEAGAMDGAYSNTLYAPWVKDVDISELLKPHQGDSSTKSIFSSGFVEQLSRNYITSRYAKNPVPARVKHPAAADTIRLGLALSNLNGLDYGLNVGAGKFVYTDFQDQLIRPTKNWPLQDTLDCWEGLRNAAVSCGAFPFAFKPVDVERHRDEYDSPDLVSQILETQSFCYTDGGTFQNQPLGMAKNLVDEIDPAHTETPNRYYLFVSPHQKKSVAFSALNAADADFIPFAKQLVSAIYNQSQFQDWIMAEDVNREIDLLNTRADELTKLLTGNSPVIASRAQSLKSAADVLLPLLFEGTGPATIDEARHRLRQQYDVEYNSLPEATRDVLIDSILALETAAHLGEKDEMKILGITADDPELAGADLCAFGGFFDYRYRKHDYDVGRKKAQDFLSDPNCPLGRIKFTAEPIDPIDATLDGLKIEQMDRGVREQVLDRLKDRILDMLEKAGVNYAVRTGMYDFYIGPKLKKLLGL
jgi:predicted acylesterase/phospholipase RssA